MPHGNHPLSGPIRPFTGVFLWTVKCALFASPFDVAELVWISFFCYEVISRALCPTSKQMSTLLPHSIASKKAPTQRLVMPENRGFTCAIDGIWVLVTDAGLPSLILWVLGTVTWSRKGSHSSKRRCAVKDHQILHHTRRRVNEIMAMVCSCNKIKKNVFFLWWKNHCSFWPELLSNKIGRCWEQCV